MHNSAMQCVGVEVPSVAEEMKILGSVVGIERILLELRVLGMDGIVFGAGGVGGTYTAANFVVGPVCSETCQTRRSLIVFL